MRSLLTRCRRRFHVPRKALVSRVSDCVEIERNEMRSDQPTVEGRENVQLISEVHAECENVELHCKPANVLLFQG